jgi:hypothetical protein
VNISVKPARSLLLSGNYARIVATVASLEVKIVSLPEYLLVRIKFALIK